MADADDMGGRAVDGVEAFERSFGCTIRAQLDWAALRSAGCKTSLVTSWSRQLLGALFTVWYEGGRAYDDPYAKSLRVRDVRPEQSPDREAHIAELLNGYLAKAQEVHLDVPVYAIPTDRYLLLDATHRSVAAYRSQLSVRLSLYVLHGPIDPAVLPDLGHYPDDRRTP